MSAGTFEVDAGNGIDNRGDHGSARRASDDAHLTYDLIVATTDVPSVVAAAGGWLCDRARAGWQVTVLVPPGQDVRALQIMGVGVECPASVAEVLRRSPAAAWAVDAGLLDNDGDVRREVQRALNTARTEVTVWGASTSCASDRRFTAVRHRLSAAARAFKKYALVTCGEREELTTTEDFRSAALWYAADGTDLVPMPAGE
ncbi:hypothetical protein [Mycolicibacterium vaccae]|uniref:hypothetical protein n=1 Tax=Mycolicibacterium vaccae TaxID=1810 RepID=UPI003CFDFF54